MLHDCVNYQQLTQFNARIDAINASIYAGSGVFLACFWHVSALRAELLCMCIAKCVHMVEMHYILTYFPLTYTTPSSTLCRYLHTCLVYMLSVFTLDPWANVSMHKRLINLMVKPSY